MPTLPLFPLGTVLMPGAQLPLQIFEPRYVALLRDLLAAQDVRTPVFGVVAIREGYEVGADGVKALHPVGCAAQLTQAAAIEDERFLIVTRGTDRFRLDGIDPGAGTPYATAEVTWLDEPVGDPVAVAELGARLRAELVAFATSVGASELEVPEEDALLAYAVPHTVSLDLGDRQGLLECSDTESRLRLALRLVRRERDIAEALGAVANPPAQPPNLN